MKSRHRRDIPERARENFHSRLIERTPNLLGVAKLIEVLLEKVEWENEIYLKADQHFEEFIADCERTEAMRREMLNDQHEENR